MQNVSKLPTTTTDK